MSLDGFVTALTNPGSVLVLPKSDEANTVYRANALRRTDSCDNANHPR